MTNKILLIALVWIAGAAPGLAEVPRRSKESLQNASEIVVGKIVNVYRHDPAGSGFRRVDLVAELKVVRVEKGTGVKAGNLIYVHYWNQVGKVPSRWTGSRGHDSRPLKKGSQVRAHLNLNKQGRREILLPNGAQAIEVNTEGAKADGKEKSEPVRKSLWTAVFSGRSSKSAPELCGLGRGAGPVRITP